MPHSLSKRINNAKKFPYLDQLHPDDRADYLAGKYTKQDKLRFLCPICGEYYLQSPKTREKGSGHKPCSHTKRGIMQRTDETYHSFADLTPEYQEKCRNKELTAKNRVDFVCNICGEIYSTILGSHEEGASCVSCASKTKKVSCQPKTDYDFLEDIHPDDRHLIGTVNNKSKVRIKCSECGDYFSQVIASRANGFTRCQKCGLAVIPHSFYMYLKTLTDNIIVNDREQIKPLEIDFYMPDYNIGFEFNDIRTHQTLFNEQEANARNFGGKPQTYHHNKFKICKEKGIRLIQIWDIEWSDDRIRPILESVIKNALGMNESRIYARKCELVISNSKECNPFFNENHIQGPAKGNGYFALKYNDEIVGAICYTKKIKLVQTGNKNNADTTISRMCFKQNTSVVGGASRLLKAVMNLMEEGQVIEYLVLNDYFDGVSFEVTGWENAKHYSMVRYYDTEKQHSYYRDPHKYQERKQKCLNGTMNRYFTSGTTVYRKEKAPSL